MLDYFDTNGVSSGGTEAINLSTEKVRRLAPEFRDFKHYELRILVAASRQRSYRTCGTMPRSEDPLCIPSG